jgi:Tol biopolymer transport system component
MTNATFLYWSEIWQIRHESLRSRSAGLRSVFTASQRCDAYHTRRIGTARPEAPSPAALKCECDGGEGPFQSLNWRPMVKRLCTGLLGCFLVACRSSHPAQPPISVAVFTPDSAAIVLSLARGEACFLYKADLTTGVMTRVTQAAAGCEFDPTFSADGKRLAYMHSSKIGVRAELVLANADGSGGKVLVPADDDNLQPAFVPDSDKIVFLRSGAFEHHSPLVDNRRHKFDLFVVDGNGHVSALTDKQFYEISHVSVSMDGRQCILAVSTYREGDHFLVMQIQKPETPAVSFQPVVPQGPSPFPVLYNATWLPDGGSLLFMAASEPSAGGNFDYNVYRLTIAGGGVEQLTRLKGMMEGFSVSPDGKRAVLLREEAYSILDLTTHQLTPVPLRWP